ncbi:MAG: hypothetical protein PV344_07980, partial [Anaplasma sp.]|nr:hypothetical protein [Anaplasma sp.]
MERDSVIGPHSHRLLIRFSCSWITQRPSSHDTALLVPKPCMRALRGLVSSVCGSQPKGRGFESCLKFFTFFFKANELLYKVISF